jgi:hypothetical protein
MAQICIGDYVAPTKTNAVRIHIGSAIAGRSDALCMIIMCDENNIPPEKYWVALRFLKEELDKQRLRSA